MNTHPTPARPMNGVSPQRRMGERPSFRFSNAATRIALGTLASAAIFGATAFLFGPVSDERTIAMAGTPHGAPFQYAGTVDKSGRATRAPIVAQARSRGHGDDDGDVVVAAGTPAIQH